MRAGDAFGAAAAAAGAGTETDAEVVLVDAAMLSAVDLGEIVDRVGISNLRGGTFAESVRSIQSNRSGAAGSAAGDGTAPGRLGPLR